LVCLGNLSPNSVLAYSNTDLIANGFIPEVGLTIRRRQEAKLLPASRLYAEFQYSIRSNISGTSLNDLSPGGNAGFIAGGLGGGAGFGILSGLGCSLQGDFEPTISRFVFHVCDSETRLNNPIVLTQAQIESGVIELPQAVIAVLGVTRDPIEFVVPEPLTAEQIARAKATTPDEIE
jgi:hypothetical protein